MKELLAGRPGARTVQRLQRPGTLCGHADQLPAGGDHPQVRRLGPDDGVDDLTHRVQDVLAIIQQHNQIHESGTSQQGERRASVTGQPERRDHGVGYGRRVGDGGQLDDSVAAGVRGAATADDLPGQRGLTDPARPDDRHEWMAIDDLGDSGDVGIPADQRLARRHWRNGNRDRPRRTRPPAPDATAPTVRDRRRPVGRMPVDTRAARRHCGLLRSKLGSASPSRTRQGEIRRAAPRLRRWRNRIHRTLRVRRRAAPRTDLELLQRAGLRADGVYVCEVAECAAMPKFDG